ncbi:MAG: hypothetical protein ACLP1D_24265, partial [Xanthobacteraceae bacterium]
MPRLRYIKESEKTPHARALIESAERTGAPDPTRVQVGGNGLPGTTWSLLAGRTAVGTTRPLSVSS